MVGTLPESVVNLRINPPRASWDCSGWGNLVPFRGGETRPRREPSLRGLCWFLKRSSSIRSLALFEYAILEKDQTIERSETHWSSRGAR
jgi:hypothetical protein